MTRILITGANGFIGTNLIKELLADPEIIIRAMIQPKTPINILEDLEKEYQKEIEMVYADLMDLSALEQAIQDTDIIVHLAALVTDWAPKELFWKIIVDGTNNLLSLAAKYSVQRFIYMSSVAVHEFGNHINDDETIPRNMKSFPYGIAKIAAEDNVTRWAQENSREYAFVRPGYNIYGLFDRGSFINVIDAIVKNQFGFISKGKAILSYVYAENLAFGIHLLINSPTVNGAYIISDGNTTWNEFIKVWCEISQSKIPKLSTSFGVAMFLASILEGIYKLFRIKKPPILNKYRIRVGGTNLGYSSAKIERELGYKPQVDLKESIKRSLDWYYSLHPKQN